MKQQENCLLTTAGLAKSHLKSETFKLCEHWCNAISELVALNHNRIEVAFTPVCVRAGSKRQAEFILDL